MPGRQRTGDADGGRDPNRGRRGQSLDRSGFLVAQHDAGADEADAGEHALQNALNDAAQRIGIMVETAIIDGREGGDGRAQGNKGQGPHAQRLALHFAIEANGAARRGRRDKSENLVPSVAVHGAGNRAACRGVPCRRRDKNGRQRFLLARLLPACFRPACCWLASLALIFSASRKSAVRPYFFRRSRNASSVISGRSFICSRAISAMASQVARSIWMRLPTNSSSPEAFALADSATLAAAVRFFFAMA